VRGSRGVRWGHGGYLGGEFTVYEAAGVLPNNTAESLTDR